LQAANGRVAIMELLSQLYGNQILVNALTKGKPGATPAHAAAIAGREDSLRYIYDNAPPPSSAVFTTSDLRGATPAMLAVEGGHTKLLALMHELAGKVLLTHKTRSSFQPNIGGWTLLHHAAFSRKAECVTEVHRLMQLETPELIMAPDDQGMDVSHVAAVAKMNGRCSPTCECHLEAGAVIVALQELGINLEGEEPPEVPGGPRPLGKTREYVPTPFWLACMNNNMPQLDALTRIPGINTRVCTSPSQYVALDRTLIDSAGLVC